jgi:hypothetical protein
MRFSGVKQDVISCWIPSINVKYTLFSLLAHIYVVWGTYCVCSDSYYSSSSKDVLSLQTRSQLPLTGVHRSSTCHSLE